MSWRTSSHNSRKSFTLLGINRFFNEIKEFNEQQRPSEGLTLSPSTYQRISQWNQGVQRWTTKTLHRLHRNPLTLLLFSRNETWTCQRTTEILNHSARLRSKLKSWVKWRTWRHSSRNTCEIGYLWSIALTMRNNWRKCWKSLDTGKAQWFRWVERQVSNQTTNQKT